MPGSSAIVLSEAAKILRLDFIPLERAFSDNFDIGTSNKQLNTLMGQNGYSATSILLNLAPYIAIYALILIANIVIKCMSAAYLDPNKRVRPVINGHSEPRLLTGSQKALNVFCRFKFATLLEFFICALINLKAEIDQKLQFESISRIVAIFFLVLIFLFLGLLFLMAVIESDIEREPDELPVAALNTLYVGMDNRKRTAANMFIIASIFRYAIFAIVMVMLQEAPGFQIQILIISSWFLTAIMWRMRPFTRLLNFVTVAFYEFLYVWSCALCIMFSPEYIHRSYQISKNMGFFICLVQFIALVVGLVLIAYSVWWQTKFYARIALEAMVRAEEARRRVAAKQIQPLEVVNEVSEESAQSQREIHR
mmetsp:Transcript_5486/g.7332  ORF Transcript_5486/g.7332 Transcript_5486/m.7332 type:complete len:366 (-) Transcript_5486:1025-2122(-)